MKITIVFIVAGLLSISASSFSQRITFQGKNIPFKEIMDIIRKQTGYTIFGTKELYEETKPISMKVRDMPLNEFMKIVTADQPLSFQIEDRVISLIRKPSTEDTSPSPISKKIPGRITAIEQQKIITGRVIHAETSEPITGVTVSIKGMQQQTSTNKNGEFNLSIPTQTSTIVLVFASVGMQTKSITYDDQKIVLVTLEPSQEAIKDVVVTGIYERPKESFSGSSATYTVKELKMIGNQNVLQSLKTLDPSFAIIENNQFGSNPNKLPDIEIRGKSSVIGLTDQYGTNPNQPLFILDGFESTLTVISDLSMDRVESITLLKDAAATAIYGSKAANGVVVVETKRPVPGRLRIDYNMNSSISFADLTDYNLMNSSEKLEFEKLSGFYGSLSPEGNILSKDQEQKYFNRLQEIKRGVDTYWPNEPLHTAINHRHTLTADGGDDNLRYSATAGYGDTEGVMKGSSRKVADGNVRLLYRKGKLSFNNSLTVNYLNANEEAIPFSRFSRANPYFRKYNEGGGIDKIMESYKIADFFNPMDVTVYNPLYDLNNNNIHKTEEQGFTNNFEMEWHVRPEMRIRTRLGLRRAVSKAVIFSSPFNSEFATADPLKQGLYDEGNERQTNFDSEASVTYGKLFQDKHMLNAVGGARFEQASSVYSDFQVEGFMDDEFANPSFALAYKEGDRAEYRESKRRGASFYLNTGYAYDQRYLFDATVRADGSSVYGSDRQFTTIWSLGAAWNLHKEPFIKNSGSDWLNELKLRASIGNPGNQNFSDYISKRIYRYNNDNRNPFGTSVILDNPGNNDLRWQKTLDRNIGLDIQLFKQRLRFNMDYFFKETDPLLVFIEMPTSTGTASYPQNLGGQLTKGFSIVANYTALQKPEYTWQINLNLRHLKSTYQHMGNALNNFNEDNKSKNLTRYYDGGSPSDLWAVRSLGIDPATGREIFLNKNNAQTFVHNYDDEVVVGNSDPDMEGIIGTSFYYKGFSASASLRYRIGGQVFMQTLYEKVENISMDEILYNQDKRALYARWQKPGDQAKFKAISTTSTTPMSSRFVEDNDILAGESFSVGYESTDATWLRKIGASSVTFRGYMNDIFHLSTVKNERGLDYPFARSLSFSIGVRF